MKLTAKLNNNEKFKHINLLIPLLTAPIAEAASVISKYHIYVFFIYFLFEKIKINFNIKAYIPFDTVRTRM